MTHETLENHMIAFSQHDYKATDHAVEANHKRDQIIAYMLEHDLTEYETDYAKIELRQLSPITGSDDDRGQFIDEFPEADPDRYWEVIATVPLITKIRPCKKVLKRLEEDGFSGDDLARARTLLDVHNGRTGWKVQPRVPDPLPPGWPDLEPGV